MTPTTPEQARELARDAALDFGWIRRAIGSLADQIESLTKERDFLTLANKDLSEAMARYQQLQDAAKMALDSSLKVFATCDWHGDDGKEAMSELSVAITELREAGVQ